jgi:segregation and condensation protein A
MSLSIKITNFEGPFDLLLHLIKKNEMDIYNIKILEITNQYLDYLKQMKIMDLDITSEFIVIAATLIEIKSKLLLPKPKLEEQEESEKDAAQELIEKLLLYKKFKLSAEFLLQREKEVGIMFTKKPEIIEEKHSNANNTENLLKNITMLDLYNIYNELINNYMNKINTNNNIEDKIKIETYKIEDKMKEIKDLIKVNSKFDFTNLLKKFTNKTEVIVTFLALLELIKLKDVKVIQDGNFKDIYIERTEQYD